MKVLLVEDNPGDVVLIREMLKESPEYFEIESAERLDRAFELLNMDSFDMVLLDLGLPDSVGLTTLDLVRERFCDIPIVVLTGLDDRTTAIEAVMKGAQDYLPKGFIDTNILTRSLKYAEERNRLIIKHREAMAELRAANKMLTKAMADLKRVEKQLVRTEKLASLGKLSAGVAHEIKNPLNIISASLQLMMMDKNASEEILEYCRTMMQQVHRAARITENLRDFARKREPETVPIDLHDFLDKTIALVEYEMRTENITVKREFHPNPIEIKGDKDQLAQVFLNLIGNARDSMIEKQKIFTYEKLSEKGWEGALRVSTAVEDGTVVIEFEDTGMGIKQENIGKIFDPFFTTKEEGVGTGLGLSIAYGIIENHDGSIEASGEEGKSAKFTIRMPMACEDDRPEADHE